MLLEWTLDKTIPKLFVTNKLLLLLLIAMLVIQKYMLGVILIALVVDMAMVKQQVQLLVSKLTIVLTQNTLILHVNLVKP